MQTKGFCIDCGDPIYVEQQPPSRYWCAKCEDERRKRITNQFRKLLGGE